jgi:ferric-dicitrate binding protein FerR (iron transport regulator)
MNNNYSDIDLAKYFAGESAPEEADGVERWSNLSSENKEKFEAARFIWEKAQNIEQRNYDTEKALSRVHGKLDFEENNQVKERSLLYYLKVVSIAAVILLPVLLFFYRTEKGTSKPVVYTETRTGKEIRLVKLPDGTEVWLNANSTLYTPKEFNPEEYRLKLEGEAFFQVSHNYHRVFIVETSAATVKVLGTAFNLRARAAEPKNVLSVVDGKVLCAKINSDVEKIVEKGSEADVSVNSPSIVLKNLKNENFLSWKTGTMKFSLTPFREVAQTLESHYQIAFEITDTSLCNLPISTTLYATPIEKVVELLEMASDEIEIKKTDKGFKVTRKQ